MSYSSPRSVRWGGLAAVAAGALFVAVAVLPDAGSGGPPFSPLEYLLVAASSLGTLLSLGGLLGLRALHLNAGALGLSGLAGMPGFGAAFFGYLVSAVLLPVPTAAEGIAGRPLPGVVALCTGPASLAFLVGEAGLLLVGLAVLRAGALPMPFRALPLAIFVLGLPLAFLALLAFGFDAAFADNFAWDVQEASIGLLWALLGLALFSGTGTGARRPTTAG